MPIIDMPLDQLMQYQGVNECPEDIDAFWDEAIAEMEQLGTDYELVPVNPGMPNLEWYHLYFTGVGGARIHCHMVKPKVVDKPLRAVCLFHGYAGNIGDFYNISGWAAAGMCCVAMDCRGQGGLSEDNLQVKGNTYKGHIIRGAAEKDPRKLYYRNVFLDTAQLARIVMNMDFVDETKVGAYGSSQGGALTLACAALTPNLNRACPCVPFLCDYKRVWDMDLDVDAYAELRDYFRLYDPLHKEEKEFFRLLGYIDNHNIAHRIRAYVRMYTGLLDTICPPSTQFAAYNRIPGKKDVRLYPDYAHEMLPGQMDDTLQFMLEM